MNQRNMSFRIYWVAAYLAVIQMLCPGCTSNSGPELAEVGGQITLDGKPVAGAGIEYIAQGVGKGVAYAKTDEQGRYKMRFGQSRTGAFVGRNLVRIYSDDQVSVGGQQYNGVEVFPPKYNVQSEQIVDVVAGINEISFACESGGLKPRQVRGGAGT